MRIPSKYKVKDTQYIHAGMRMVGIDVNYQTADLIMKVVAKVKEKGGDMNIEDTVEIEMEHERHWNTIQEEIDKEAEK
jgi:hypothetical protein